MADIISAEKGIIIEQPYASETFERLKEPDATYKIKNQNFDKVKKWQARIEVARKIRDLNLFDLNKLINFYEGIQWHLDELNFPSVSDKATINVIFANIKKELPNLYFQNPTPIVKPTRQEFEFFAFALQALLKHYTQFNLGTELKRHVRLALLDAKFSFGCLKASYTPRFGTNPNAGNPIIAGYDDFREPIFVFDDEKKPVFEDDEMVISELYAIQRVSPREMLIDPQCRNFIKQAGWLGQEIIKPLKYLKDHNLYKNTHLLDKNIELSEYFQNTLNKKEEEISATREFYGEDTELVKFVEIYDFKEEELLVLPDDKDFFIREEDVFINPYSFIKFNELPDSFYPVPDVRIEKPLQQEVNVGRSLMITHARRSTRKYYYSDETFRNDDDEIEKAKSPEDMAFFKIQDYDQPPKPLDMATQDPAVFQNIYQSRIDFNEVTGSTEMERGVTERRKTKGEATFQESHSAIRKGDKQSLVADFISDTYENLAKLMQKTLMTEQAVQIIGPSGMFWTSVNRDHIKGEFKFEIDVSELRPQIPEVDRQELSEFIFAIANFLNAVLSNPIGAVVFDLQGTIGEFAKSFPSINVEKILNMKVTPEQIAQMLMQQMQQNQTSIGE